MKNAVCMKVFTGLMRKDEKPYGNVSLCVARGFLGFFIL
jgi:hypothetical protein